MSLSDTCDRIEAALERQADKFDAPGAYMERELLLRALDELGDMYIERLYFDEDVSLGFTENDAALKRFEALKARVMESLK